MNDRGIELINVHKEFNNMGRTTRALNNVSFSIRPGEFIGLMGMNGSGKSTLARLLNGLICPSQGKIYVNGMDTSCADNLVPIRTLVGMVFQNPDNQLICPIVEEEIAFGPENLGLPISEIERRVEMALQTVGLAELRHHSPHMLSGGQKQKVALASVLAMQPVYLVLDEPTSMLDPVSRRDLLQHLRELNRSGMTIILISHDPEDLLYAERLIVLDEGTICLQGTSREVYAQEKKLTDLGWQLPGIYHLVRQLQTAGVDTDQNINTIAELMDSLWPI